MICPKCKSDGILNTILGKDFYYCRTCKEEILLEEVDPDKGAIGKEDPFYLGDPTSTDLDTFDDDFSDFFDSNDPY